MKVKIIKEYELIILDRFYNEEKEKRYFDNTKDLNDYIEDYLIYVSSGIKYKINIIYTKSRIDIPF